LDTVTFLKEELRLCGVSSEAKGGKGKRKEEESGERE